MAYVRRRGAGSYEVTLTLGTDAAGAPVRRYVTVKAPSKREAQAQASELERHARRGDLALPAPGAALTVADLLARWLEVYVAARVGSPNTRYTYRNTVERNIVPRLGAVRVDKLAPAHLEDLEAYWRTRGRLRNGGGPLAPETVRQYRRVLHGALEWARRRKLIGRNPYDDLDPLPAERTRRPVLAEAQARAYLRCVLADQESPWRLPLAVMLATGMRLSEVRGLRWADVDLATGRFVLLETRSRVAGVEYVKPTKSHKSDRPGALPAGLVAQLREHHKAQLAGGAAGDLVFCDGAGEPFKPWMLRRRHYRYLDAAGCPRVHVHDLRHTFASLQAAKGATLQEVSALLGHAGIQTTANIYLHMFDGFERAAAARMDGFFAAPDVPDDPGETGAADAVCRQNVGKDGRKGGAARRDAG